VTDANLMLGYLPADRPMASEIELRRDLAEEAITRLASSLKLDPTDCAAGIVRVANAEMVRALRVVTVERGIDPRRYALLAFGGAGPLHAAAIADELGIEHVLCPHTSGVLAALGLVVSPRRRDAQRTVLLVGEEFSHKRLAAVVEELASAARAPLDNDDATIAATFELRYRGQAFELAVQAPPDATPDQLKRAFTAAHEDRYGYSDSNQPIELVTIRVTATIDGAPIDLADNADADGEPPSQGRRSAVLGGKELELETIAGLPPAGTKIPSPAVVELPETTVLIPPGWCGEVDPAQTLHLHREAEANSQ
jgi:N-methylhydantoinase A